MEIRALLLAGESLSVYDLAERFRISVRTARRYLETLLKSGEPLEEDWDGQRKVWRIVETARRLSVPLSISQMTALCLSRHSFDFLAGTGLREDLDDLFAKLQLHLGRKDRAAVRNLDRKLFDVNEAPRIYEGRFEDLNAIVTALLREQRLDVEHVSRGGSAKRLLVDPYTLLVYKKGLYLAGFSHAHNEIRTFALDGLRDVQWRRGDGFEYPADYHPAQLVEGAFGIIRGPRVQVRIRFSKEAAPFVERRRWHPTQEIKAVPDGIELSMEVAGTTELASFVLGFGAEAEVIEPPELRSQIANTLARGLALYG